MTDGAPVPRPLPARSPRSPVPRLLAARWWRDGRRGWWLAVAVLGAVLGAGLGAAGLVEGMQGAAEARVADAFTDALRVTPGPPGAAPQGRFNATEQAELALAGGDLRLETQFLLSRRSLVAAYLTEQEGIDVAVPGTDPASTDAYGLGVLLGLTPGGLAPLGGHLAHGRLPSHDPERIELLLGEKAFRGFLSEAERAAFERDPAAILGRVQFELTAARLKPGPVKDILRFPAQAVGVWRTQLDPLDAFVAATDLESARQLVGEGGGANAATFSGAGADRGAALAQRSGWGTDTAAAFAERYVGQVVGALRIGAALLGALLVLVPAGLVGLAVRNLLERQRREIAVCRAIGIPASAIRSGLVRLAARVLVLGALLGLAVAAALAASVAAAAPAVPSPLPVAFAVPWMPGAVSLVLLAGATAAAVLAAARSSLRAKLAPLLRAF